MITGIEAKLTKAESSQLERRDLAVGSWRQGAIENAEVLLDSVLAEPMTPRVAVKSWVSKAAFRAGAGDFEGSLRALDLAAEFLDAADLRFRGAFHNQRARVHNKLGNTDSALMDYTGASSCFEDAGDKSYQGAACLNIAELYLQRGDLGRARENIDRAMSLFKDSDSEYLSQGYDTLAKLELAEGKIENAVAFNQRALDLTEENEIWRKTFLDTRDRIETKLLELMGVRTVEDFNAIQVAMVRRALSETGGNLTRAGELVGLTHKGVAYIVDRHPELEQFRAKRRSRTKHKSIIKL